MTSAAAKAKEEMESARAEVIECEREIQTIKGSLRDLATASNGEEGENSNSLEISALKVQGLPETAKPSFVLQLSSPVEELTLTKMFDPLEVESTAAETTTTTTTTSTESKAVFQGVEMSVATLTVSANDLDIPLGVSAMHDLSTLFSSDEKEAKKSVYVNELDVAIVAEDGAVTTPVEEVKVEDETGKAEEEGFQDALEDVDDAAASPTKAPKDGEEETKGEDDKEEPKEGDGEDTKEETASPAVVSPVCTVTLRLTFTPSAKDKKEELYEELNKASQRKAQAIERLRRNATAVSRAAAAPSAGTGPDATSKSSAAVKAGFLNKKPAAETAPAKPNPLVAFYEKVLGPQSMTRAIFPVVKNYIIFFGCAAFIQFRGHLLALPPPV
mmetsp:Transcript_21447/g.33048  ORF Transcript_21447/g.33048 Transcript_21447/m.33048 type:complete len:386 (-) Transcript_21447:81-1238(-)|eukprot:CAMPEP_0195294052 /NCGR_PEP_ID=MMETSP0707-20130614/14081_1 /TAXON_ID=33640 /ORGANISM="Asterionellopsis glacialis, Strain CCMP134" /LENGTH=385 /DNA_ID=CAMNT_0040354933 /DNA_START=55 /DNA_END=1212 /DNA_ORIENTATION=-